LFLTSKTNTFHCYLLPPLIFFGNLVFLFLLMYIGWFFWEPCISLFVNVHRLVLVSLFKKLLICERLIWESNIFLIIHKKNKYFETNTNYLNWLYLHLRKMSHYLKCNGEQKPSYFKFWSSLPSLVFSSGDMAREGERRKYFLCVLFAVSTESAGCSADVASWWSCAELWNCGTYNRKNLRAMINLF